MYEVRYTPEKIKAVMEAIQNKGWVILRDEKITTNTAGIEDVMNAEQYKNWIETQRPREFILNGIWYYGTDKTIMRIEPWREKIKNQKKLLQKTEDQKPNQKRINEIKNQIRKNLPPPPLYFSKKKSILKKSISNK